MYSTIIIIAILVMCGVWWFIRQKAIKKGQSGRGPGGLIR